MFGVVGKTARPRDPRKEEGKKKSVKKRQNRKKGKVAVNNGWRPPSVWEGPVERQRESVEKRRGTRRAHKHQPPGPLREHEDQKNGACRRGRPGESSRGNVRSLSVFTSSGTDSGRSQKLQSGGRIVGRPARKKKKEKRPVKKIIHRSHHGPYRGGKTTA